MKLYVYDHCPFCVKARMIFGLTQTPLELIYLLNDDEETPTRLIGKKMAPILEKPDGTHMPESMDIVHYIDSLQPSSVFTEPQNPSITTLLNELGAHSFKLIAPRNPFVGFAEFKTKSAQDYFINKKSAMIGDFEQHRQQSETYIAVINQLLSDFVAAESAVLKRDSLSIDDIHLFASLRCLTVVKGIIFPEQLLEYLSRISEKSGVNLLFERAI